MGDLGFNTAVLSFIDTTIFGVHCARIEHRPWYRTFWIPRYSGFSGQVSVRDCGIAFSAYRGLVPFWAFIVLNARFYVGVPRGYRDGSEGLFEGL